jgi:hypothetical protein
LWWNIEIKPFFYCIQITLLGISHIFHIILHILNQNRRLFGGSIRIGPHSLLLNILNNLRKSGSNIIIKHQHPLHNLSKLPRIPLLKHIQRTPNNLKIKPFRLPIIIFQRTQQTNFQYNHG